MNRRVEFGVFHVVPRTPNSEGKDLAGMAVPLDCDAWLESDSDYPKPRRDISLQELENYTLLILDKGQIFLCPVKRLGNSGHRCKSGSYVCSPFNLAAADTMLFKNYDLRIKENNPDIHNS